MTLGACRDKSLLNSQFDNNASRYERATTVSQLPSTLSEESRDFSAADSQKDRGSRKPPAHGGVEWERIEAKKGKEREKRKEEKKNVLVRHHIRVECDERYGNIEKVVE